MSNKTIDALRKRSRKTITVEDPDHTEDKYEFSIRALSPFELADHSQIFDNLPKEGVVLDKNMPEAAAKSLKEVVLPMMKVFLPMCTVEPRITFNRDEESNTVIHIGDVPMMVASIVFKEILDLSGISAEADKERKKKSQKPTQSSTQP